jgi:hypothetical protein
VTQRSGVRLAAEAAEGLAHQQVDVLQVRGGAGVGGERADGSADLGRVLLVLVGERERVASAFALEGAEAVADVHIVGLVVHVDHASPLRGGQGLDEGGDDVGGVARALA